MSFSVRVMTIIHLCLVFWYLAWSCMQPFLSDYMNYQRRVLLYRNVMGDVGLISGDSEEELRPVEVLQRNAERFAALDGDRRQSVSRSYEQLQGQPPISLASVFERVIYQLTQGIPPFIQAWLLFSLVVCFLLLFRVDGAAAAAWVLPLVVGFHLIAAVQEEPALPSPDQSIYPSEEVIIRDYLGEPLSSGIMEQREQLLRGWHLYLVRKWARESVDEDPHRFALQVEEGEFLFNVARLEKLSAASEHKPPIGGEPWPLVLLNFFWNLFFAVFVSRRAATVWG